MAAFIRSGEPQLTVGGKADYVNFPDRPPQRPEKTDLSGRGTFRLVAVSFGLLCCLQSILNISLRLYLYNSAEMECTNSQMENGNLQTSYNTLVAERDSLMQRLDQCSDGWREFGESLYFVSSGRKTWNDSLKDCETREAHLIIINSQEEQGFLKRLANGHRVWIGLTRPLDPKGWRWVDGSLLTKKFWVSGQPDNTKADSPNGEQCVENNAHFDGWNDLACNFTLTWICEKNSTV